MLLRHALLGVCTLSLLALPLPPTLSLQAALAQSASAEAQRTVCQEKGTLQPGDATASDGSLYDEYSFEGRAGQAVLITLESTQFDPYLFLLNSQGDTLAKNDDAASENPNSRLAVTLPADGIYRVWANAYD